MAQPTPASSSDRPTGRVGEPMARRRAPTSDGEPGLIRVATIVDGALQELEGDAAVTALPRLLAEPEASVWVDLAAPSPDQVQAIGPPLGLHPLIVEDVLEGNQRAKIETTDGIVHIVLFALDREESVAINEVDLVLGPSYLFTVHGSGWDPASPTTCATASPRCWPTARTICSGRSATTSSMATSRTPTGWATPSTTCRTRSSREPNTEALERVFSLKRELIEVRRAASPTREVFNQLTNRDVALIDADEIVYFRDVYDHVIRLTDETGQLPRAGGFARSTST